MKRLVLVDGNALLHRAYHATPPLSNSKGELLNAVYGFTSMLLKGINDLNPDFIAVAWDVKGPTFRHQAYTQYKATRGPADDGLSSQYERVYQVIKSLNIPEYRLAGYEADDLIGTLARLATEKEKNLEVIVITGDRDIMQIINDRVKILMPRKTLTDVGLYGEEEFAARFGFEPIQMIEYKALAGDASDNIPGVQGIGDVSATKLIQKFGNIEKIYKPENLKTLPPRMQTLLAEGAESAVMSKNLATIDVNAPIKLDLAECRVHEYDHQKAVALFEDLEFKSLIARLPGNDIAPEILTEGMNAKVPGKTQNPHTTDLDLEVDKVLQKMTEAGVLIDKAFLDKLGEQLKAKLAKTEQELYSKVGHQFNPNSPKQLSEILFDELKLPVIRKTKTGRSTDEATLQELSTAHPMVPLLLEYRQLFKLISTYIDALPKYIDQKDGRIHSTFNVEGAATGRLSSINPNLQNIPIRGEMGGELRKAFIAPPGKILLRADYSQIELRIMAHLSKDENLSKAFTEGIDIHALTASKIFNIPVDKIDPHQRNVGKTMNFATLYGQGAHALSQQLKVDFATARQYIAEYFEQFPKVREWMQETLEFGYKNGFVETIWGRRRYIPELQASNHMLKAAGERMAINMPVQGTQADMIKKAMVEIDKELSGLGSQLSEKSSSVISQSETDQPKTGKLPSESQPPKTDHCNLILQVHDELLFECNKDSLEETARMVKQKMEEALKLSVPVIVDLKVGPNWGEMEPLKI